MNYRIEKYKTAKVSWTTGVSPKTLIRYRIVRNSDDRIMEVGIETLKRAEQIASYIPNKAKVG